MDELTRLLLAARSGDRTALAALVERTYRDVWRFCAHLVGPDSADDAVQDTYLRAIRTLPRFRGDASARTWLLAVARNTCIDLIRARERRRRGVRVAVAPERIEADPTDEVAFHDLLAHVTLDRRIAFVLTRLVGLSYADTAEVLGVPLGTVRSRVARAREDLIALLGERARR